jgi:DNA-binding transcriptional ArsR family regulator
MPEAGVTYNQMVAQMELSDDRIDRVFHALAAATRRDILRRTIEAEHSVSALAREYDMSFAAVQKHVAVLEEAGLIVKRAEGRERLVRADPVMIARARVLLARFEELWRSRIDRLDALLAEPAGATGAPADPPDRNDTERD